MKIKITNLLVRTLLICIILLANNLTLSLSVTGMNIISDEGETEYWAVLVDTSPGPIGIIDQVKTCLIQHGWEEDHIKMVFNVTYNDFKSAISWLSERADTNDVVLLCSNSHGLQGRIKLSDRFLYYNTIDKWLDQLNVKGIFYSISACHSGSAIPILGKEGRVIMTACNSDESGGTAWLLNFLYASYDLVKYHQGYDDAPSPNGAFYRRDNDLNGDGWVSAEETFSYAKGWTESFHNDYWIFTDKSGDDPIHPQMYDGYYGELNICRCTQNPPNKPACYYKGKNIELIISSMDLEGDKVRYGISWDNDGNVDSWTEFNDSGLEVSINCIDRKETIGVIAEDELGAQSEWAIVKESDLIELNYAIKYALRYLIGKSIPTENGFKWPLSENDNESYTDLYEGTPGVCLLFLKAYEITGNELYLYYAQAGMKWLMSIAVEENEGYKWPYHENSNSYFDTGLYTGAAGIGSTFLDFYQTLDNASYLEYAEGAAKWLISIGEIEHDDQVGITCKWPWSEGSNEYSIDLFGGATGIGIFFLQLYNVTGNETYLDYAKYAGNWLITQAYNLGIGCYVWPAKPITFSPLKFYFSPGFAHGTSGVGDFFVKLYKLSSEEKYLKYAEGAGKWLIRCSVYDFSSGGVKWRWSFDNLALKDIHKFFMFAYGWCHGPAGICKFFIDLYEITDNPIYLKYAERGAKWLMSTAISEGGGYKWPGDLGRMDDKIFVGKSMPHVCCGVAGIGEFFLEMYELTQKPAYHAYARGASEWLKYVAIYNGNGGCKWEVDGQYKTGYYKGTAGIALFLLKIDMQ